MFTKLLRKSLLAAASVCLSTGVAWSNCNMRMVLVMPITMVGSQPLVTVKLNGTEVHLLMDTGSFFNFITPEAAKRAGLSVGLAPEGLGQIQGAGGTIHPGETTVQDFMIGKNTLHRVSFLVFGDQLASRGVDGVLAQNFLRLTGVADIEIDLANGVARMFINEGCDHSNLAYWAGSAPVNELNILPTSQGWPEIIASAQLNGSDIRVMFDTGASASDLSIFSAQRLGVTPQSPGVVSGGIMGGLGDTRRDSWIAPFKSFKLDLEETQNTRLRISDIGALPEGADMLLGADFFLSHRVYISYVQSKMYFTYNGGPVFDLRIRGAPPTADQAQPPGPDNPGAGTGAAATLAGATSSAAGPGAAPAAPPTGLPPGNAADYDRRAQASGARGDSPAAIADFGLAIAADPGNAQYHLHRGEALVRSGHLQQGLADLDEALRLQPDLTDALMLRGEIRVASNNLDGAKADFVAAEASAPGRSELPLQEAGEYVATGHYPLALPVLNNWIVAHPQDQRLYDALSQRCLVRACWLQISTMPCQTATRLAATPRVIPTSSTTGASCTASQGIRQGDLGLQ